MEKRWNSAVFIFPVFRVSSHIVTLTAVPQHPRPPENVKRTPCQSVGLYNRDYTKLRGYQNKAMPHATPTKKHLAYEWRIWQGDSWYLTYRWRPLCEIQGLEGRKDAP